VENLISDFDPAQETWLKPSKVWLMVGGAALIIFGLLAIFASFAATMISVVALGFLLLGAGIFQAIISVKSRWSGFALHLLLALFYAGAGLLLILRPFNGAVDLTLMIGFFFIISGVVRIVSSLVERYSRWGWSFLSGLITTGLGLFVLFEWPAISFFLVGLLVGIDLIFFGNYLFAFGLAIRREEGTLKRRGTTLSHASI
jgi:uncharacterized membrane protein HdeD (DUF308 family)